MLKAIVKAVKVVVKVVKKVVKAVKKYARVIAAVAVAVIAPYAVAALMPALSAGAVAIVGGAIGGGLAGLITTGSLKGMLIGALSGAAFAGIGNHFAGKVMSNVNKGLRIGVDTLKSGLTAAQQAGKILMHGVAGGLRSVLSGGKFKAGFLSAGFTQAAAPAIGHIENDFGQAVAAGVVGGFGSELAGGKFEDGFVTGVFSHSFNELAHKWNSRPPLNPEDYGYSVEDLDNANLKDLLKFGKNGEWNARDRFYSDPINAKDSFYLRQNLTDLGNWAYGRASAAAGLPIAGAWAIGGLKQLSDNKQLGPLSSWLDNPRDHEYITQGYNSSPHMGILDGGSGW